MGWFNHPVPCPQPAARGVEMALAIRDVMSDLTSKWRKRGHRLDFSVGTALGYATWDGSSSTGDTTTGRWAAR